MKRITLYQIINLILLIIYGVSVLVQKNAPLFNLSWTSYWFPTLCLFVSISMFIKTIMFHSDSSLWLFVTLLFLSAGIYLLNIYHLRFSTYWVVILSIVSLASMLVGLFFKEIYQVKISLVFLFISVPFYLFFFSILNFWWCLLILVVALYGSVLMTLLLPERWYANKPNR